MFILNGILACARYVAAFVLILGAATFLNVGIVLGWNYLNADSFSRTVSLAMEAADPGAGPADPGGDASIQQASVQ